MDERADYIGALEPDIKFEDFSKEILVEALYAFSDYMRKLDGLWYLAVKDMMGNERAKACDVKVWEKAAGLGFSMLSKLFKIEGDDVAAWMKCMQLGPMAQASDMKIDLINNDDAVLTFNHCPTLTAMEREGEGRDRDFCDVIHRRILEIHANFLDPNIEVIALKLPPRNSTDEIACQWEFKLQK